MKDTPGFAHAAVAAPHHLAAEAGRAVLIEGGNAIEAMIAMAAVIPVVYPHMNHIGGDGFWLIRTPEGKAHAIEACGYAGEKATIKAYRAKGYDAIPVRGADAALTVAGAIGGWMKALELSAARGGRIPVRDLLAAAEAHCRTGVPVGESEGRYSVKELEAILAVPNFAAHFMGKDGKQPKTGDIRVQPKLGDTFAQLRHAGLDDFYRGDLAREIAADLDQLGSPVTREDLRRYEAKWREPLVARMKGVTLYNCPPPTQGLTSLMIHGIFDRLDAKEPESFAHIHGLVEAAKRAYATRDRVVTDFDRLAVDPQSFLTPENFAREAARINAGRAAAWPFASADGDTIWMGAIDADGMAVSFIQSIYWEYGSGLVLPRTGILWQNRGLAFSLDPKALNPLEPGRRPFHTLNTPLAAFDDGRVLSYGAMGGDGQPQFHAQIYMRAIRYGLSLSEALDRPRFLFGKTWGKDSATLKLENRFDPSLIMQLEKAGHVVEVVPKPYADGFGHAGMLMRHADGHVEADHDPRSDGGAAGL
jgi:gamma-glutamyltranspeptidase/glutathione hydrolase